MIDPVSADGVTGFVAWFRRAAPYINAHRGRTFVIEIDGESAGDPRLHGIVHDLALLRSLGVDLVVVHGARPWVERCIEAKGLAPRYVEGVRITDVPTLDAAKEAIGAAHVELEALLSMGVANSPMAGAKVRVASGNFITARPIGVRDGVDYEHSGEVRRIDIEAIRQRLAGGAIVLVPPLGYSPTGEVFSLRAEEVATAIAAGMRAAKLVFLCDGPPGSSTGRARWCASSRSTRPRPSRSSSVTAGAAATARSGTGCGGRSMPAATESAGSISSIAGSTAPCCWSCSPATVSAP